MVLSHELISVSELKNGLSFLEDDLQLVVKPTGSEKTRLAQKILRMSVAKNGRISLYTCISWNLLAETQFISVLWVVIWLKLHKEIIYRKERKATEGKEVTEGKKLQKICWNIKLFSTLSVIFSIIPCSTKYIILKSIVFIFLKSKTIEKKRKIFIYLDALNVPSNSSIKSNS